MIIMRTAATASKKGTPRAARSSSNIKSRGRIRENARIRIQPFMNRVPIIPSGRSCQSFFCISSQVFPRAPLRITAQSILRE